MATSICEYFDSDWMGLAMQADMPDTHSLVISRCLPQPERIPDFCVLHRPPSQEGKAGINGDWTSPPPLWGALEVPLDHAGMSWCYLRVVFQSACSLECRLEWNTVPWHWEQDEKRYRKKLDRPNPSQRVPGVPTYLLKLYTKGTKHTDGMPFCQASQHNNTTSRSPRRNNNAVIST